MTTPDHGHDDDQEHHVTDTPHRTPFDPTCDRWTTFAELHVGDWIDYWGAARPVAEHIDFGDGRVRIIVNNANGGRDMALAPDTEGTWRATRDNERLGHAENRSRA